MSICAFYSKDKKVSAIIKWLHQAFWIGEKGNSFCIFEFIVDVEKGRLKNIEICFPYKISNLKDGTKDLFLEDNKYFYDGHEVLLYNTEKDTGKITLDGITTYIEPFDINIKDILIGNAIKIEFNQAIEEKSSRAIRIRFSCDRIANKKHNEIFGLFLEYYDTKAANRLNILNNNIFFIEKIFIWIILPDDVEYIQNANPHFEKQTLTRSIMPEYSALYGPNFDTEMQKGGNRFVCLWKFFPTVSVLQIPPWLNKYFYCEYKLFDKDLELTEKKLHNKNEIVIYSSHQAGFGVFKEIGYEDLLTSQYLDNKKNYDIVVYHQNIEIKKVTNNKIIFESIELDENILNIFILFIKYKDKKIPFNALYNKAWEKSVFYESHEKIPPEVMNRLKTSVSNLRRTFANVQNFTIPKARGGGYVCKGGFNFCLILDKSTDDWYTLEGI